MFCINITRVFLWLVLKMNARIKKALSINKKMIESMVMNLWLKETLTYFSLCNKIQQLWNIKFRPHPQTKTLIFTMHNVWHLLSMYDHWTMPHGPKVYSLAPSWAYNIGGANLRWLFRTLQTLFFIVEAFNLNKTLFADALKAQKGECTVYFLNTQIQ